MDRLTRIGAGDGEEFMKPVLETAGEFIVDFTVATGVGQFKTAPAAASGAQPGRGEPWA